jgi:outer membrane protein TolC
MLFWTPASLFAREVSLEEAIAIAAENNPELAVAANELLIARGELQRANTT